jgi:hypothetical protein
VERLSEGSQTFKYILHQDFFESLRLRYGRQTSDSTSSHIQGFKFGQVVYELQRLLKPFHPLGEDYREQIANRTITLKTKRYKDYVEDQAQQLRKVLSIMVSKVMSVGTFGL